LRASAAELNQLLRSVRAVVDRVRTGPGFVHEVIYEESGSQALSQVGGAAEEVGLALKGIREGDSFAHGMLYEKESAEMVDNLNRASADLQAIVEDVRAGKGTLGAFLVDPSVYEDVKVLLGNVGRNRSLRALVRYSIQQDEDSGRVVDPAPDQLNAGGEAKTQSGASAGVGAGAE
jgi:phospholipid/cholesterol/gamma-HCH transport system substrate-binding protein